MNNNVQKRLFGYPKVKWLHLTGLIMEAPTQRLRKRTHVCCLQKFVVLKGDSLLTHESIFPHVFVVHPWCYNVDCL